MFNKNEVNNNEVANNETVNTELAEVSAAESEVKMSFKDKAKAVGAKVWGVAKKVLPVAGGIAVGVVGTLAAQKLSSGDDDDDDYDEEYDEDDSSDEE